MTYAPARLLDVRHYLQSLTGLSDNELGIVGDAAHVGGYHHGWDQRSSDSDYSWSESARDSSHKTNAARALDIGMFARLRELSVWLVTQCAAGAPDTADIREVIYSADGRTVKRWDRLGYRTSGDSSHLTHTHISFFADAEERDKTAVFRRFFEGDDMSAERTSYNADQYLWQGLMQLADVVDGIRVDDGDPNKVVTVQNGLAKALKGLAADVAELKSRSLTLSEEQLTRLADLMAARMPQAATKADVRDAVADLGEGGAAAVRAEQ